MLFSRTPKTLVAPREIWGKKAIRLILLDQGNKCLVTPTSGLLQKRSGNIAKGLIMQDYSDELSQDTICDESSNTIKLTAALIQQECFRSG